MTRKLVAGALLVLLLVPHVARSGDGVDLRQTVQWLSSARWEGRGNGSAQLTRLAGELQERLRPYGRVERQDFEATEGESLTNLFWLRPGTAEPKEWIVLAAHYDHLGRGASGDPHEGEIYFGADDNASGVAVAMGTVARLHDFGASDRSVCVVLFAGEEIGLQGSQAFLKDGPLSDDTVLTMINLDSVGRWTGEGLTVFGVESSPGFSSTLDGINSAYGLTLKPVARSSGGSDDATFASAGIATLHLFTGAHGDYHRPSDTAEQLDYAAMEVLADFTADLVDYLAAGDTELSFVPAGAEAVRPDPKRATEGRRRVSFGSIPDFQFAGPGVKITGVLPGSPAEEAGLAADDVILAFGGEAVADLTDYSEAMKLYSPGDEVEVRFLRGDEQLQVMVTLVERK
jgi:Peptidase family M28/PDZ domain